MEWRAPNAHAPVSTFLDVPEFHPDFIKQAMSIFSRLSTAPTDLELVLQASIARKQRLAELEREPAAAPPPQKVNANDLWIASGGNANVQGFATGDLVYVGKRIPSLDGRGIEPSAIDPSLPVDPGHANTLGEGVTYWPSYHSISAASRTAYLRWLNGGRADEQVYIGYVFVFFYGLERRVYELIRGRGSSAEEMVAIGHEVARLLKLYADRSSSFARYGGSLLDLIAAIEPRVRPVASNMPAQPGDGLPRWLAVELGELAVAGNAVPARLAYDWLRASRYLNTPATRCQRELELLFHIRYAAQFGAGIFLQANKTVLRIEYHPANAALDPLDLPRHGIPDVSEARLLAKIADLGQECSSALDAFSRFLGKNPAARESLAAFALLPDDLVEGTHSADARSLAELVASRLDVHGRAQLGAGELLQYVRVAKPEKVSKSEAMLLAQALEKLGYGVEPDVRLGGPAFAMEDPVVVFRRLPDCPSTASDEYATAMICMRLGTVVSTADDEISEGERTLLEQHIAEALQLSAGERQRLGAHLAWLIQANPGTSGLKKRLAALAAGARQHIGRLLVSVATTDAQIHPREMKILEKLYALLGLQSADLYRDVHAAQAAGDEPVAVDTAAPAPKGFAIPPKPAPAATTAAGLDMSRVRLKIAETRQVSALLGSIFVEEEGPVVAAAQVPSQQGTIGTLDATHSELLRRLAVRESWPRDEVERMASELSLMTDGALETINDYAYATADEAFWEDADPLTINGHVAMELTR